MLFGDGGVAASEWDRKATHNLEFTANVLVCWDLSEPSLSLMLLWILKYPHLSISLPNFFSTHLFLFFFLLFFIQPLIFVLLLDVHDAPLSVSFIFSFCLFITARMGFMSYRETVKTRASPRGVSVREQSKEREAHCLLFLIEFFILIHETYITVARAKATDHMSTL